MLHKLALAGAVAALLATPVVAHARMAGGYGGGAAHVGGAGGGMGARSFSGGGMAAHSFGGSMGARSFGGAVGTRSFAAPAGRSWAGHGFAGPFPGHRHHHHFRGAPFVAGAVGLGLGLGYWGDYDDTYYDSCWQLQQTPWGWTRVNVCTDYYPY